MDTKEINKLLKSEAALTINEAKFILRFPIAAYVETFELSGLYRFVNNQIKSWEDHGPLPPQLLKSKNYFLTIEVRINQLLENLKNEQNFSHSLKELQSAINNNNEKMIPGYSSEAVFLVSVFNDSLQIYTGSYAFLGGEIHYPSFSNKEYLQGIILSVLYKIKCSATYDNTLNEEKSFNSLRKKVEKYIIESDNNLNDLLLKSQDKIDNFVEVLDKIKNDDQEKLNKWFSLNQATARDVSMEIKEERENIEKTYRQLLQLQAPAQHWKESGEKLLKEGHIFMMALFVLIFIGALSLYLLLWKTPEGMLVSFFNGDKAAAIRWSIVFVTFISLIFFGIQSLRKAMFSSFHLARDAQEREKLTMYYLSLLKEGALGNEDKNLILQSLFSRSDSGLLKDDGSPTMPGIIDRIRN